MISILYASLLAVIFMIIGLLVGLFVGGTCSVEKEYDAYQKGWKDAKNGKKHFTWKI